MNNLSRGLNSISLGEPTPGRNTPARTEALSEASDEELADLVATWEDAIYQCEHKLNPKDYQKALQFSTPEKLLDDLKERAKDTSRTKPWLSRLYIEMSPTVRMLEKTSAIFLAAMQPKAIETRMIFVLFYVIIELSLQNGERWAKMQAMLEKATLSLQLCRHTAQWIDEEVRSVLLKIFKTLILFWANSAQFMKTNPSLHLTSIEVEFEATIKAMDAAVNVLEHYATMRKLAPSDRNLDQDRDLAAYRGPLKSGTAFPCHDLPLHEDNVFCGRQTELDLIDEVLSPLLKGIIRQRALCVYGIGGVGKSRIALAYASRCRDSFDAIFVIPSENNIAVSRSFTRVARKLRLREQEQSGNAEEDNELVQQWLLESGKRWLLIWDNVEDFDHIRSYWPSSTGSLLLTTRYKAVAAIKGEMLHIQPFDSAAAWNLFATIMDWDDLSTVPDSEAEAARSLLLKLQGLALGIRQMAALIKVKDKGVEHFLGRYKKGRVTNEGSKLDDCQFSLDTVWKESFSAVRKGLSDEKNPHDGFHLLGVIVFLSPDDIPNEIFTNYNADTYPSQLAFCQDEQDFEDAAEKLTEMALIDATLDHQALFIHRLVQDAFDKSLDALSRQKYFDCAVMLVYNAFPQQVQGRPLDLQWAECEKYIQHVKHLTNYYRDSQSTRRRLTAPLNFTELLKSCAWYLYEIGDKTDALALVTLAMNTCKEPDSILYAHLANTTFGIYIELNDLRKARRHGEAALAIRKRLDTEEEYSNTLSNMGNLYSAEGRLADALRCFDASETIRQRLGNEGIIGLALTRLGIGRAHALQGDYAAAETRFTMAQEAILRTFGPDGHFMPDVHYALGNLHRLRGDLPAARTHYTEGLRVLHAQGMPTHIFNTAFLYKLACISIAGGDLQPAQTMLAKALTLAEPSRQSSPGDMARILYKQAGLLRLLGHAADSPEVAEKEVVSVQLRELIERERLPVRGGEAVVGAEGEEDAAYDRLVCAFLR